MNNNIDNKTLLDFSAGKYSYKDYLRVRQWFFNAEDKNNLEEELYDQWKGLIGSDHPDVGSLHGVFEKIQYHILLEEKKREKKKNLWYFYRQVAAFLLVPVLLFSLLFYMYLGRAKQETVAWAEIDAPKGARIAFFLPDSTSGWLNGGAKLKYPLSFGKQRKVELTGEAWLEVKHKTNSGFTVSVADLDINVTGTSFNVSAYADDDYTEIVLKEGSIIVNGKTGIFSHKLSPEEKLTYNRVKNSIRVKKVETNLYSAWKDGYLVLDNEPIGQVVGRLGRWYNADITIQDEILKRYRFKATFKDEPLEEVLRLLALTTPISYEIKKRDMDNKGVFTKKRVTIKLNK